MTTTRTTTKQPVVNTVDHFLEALGRLDFKEVEQCLATDVWFRALQAKGVHESKTANDAADAFRGWFNGTGGTRLLDCERHTTEGREHLRYRFLLRPEWASDQWHLVEQTGFCRVKDGKITRLDVVCSGFFPVENVRERTALPNAT
jgi:ketosteroid isomerase-like protein